MRYIYDTPGPSDHYEINHNLGTRQPIFTFLDENGGCLWVASWRLTGLNENTSTIQFDEVIDNIAQIIVS